MNDSTAFASLFRKYYEPLYRFSTRFVRDPQTAESLVQDVFVRLWEIRKDWHVRSSVKAYLFTAVRNRSLNHLKREKTLVPVDESLNLLKEESASPEEAFIDDEITKSVHRAIDRLPNRCRLIYRMNRYDGYKYSEIAEMLGISTNTVKTQMRRALQLLKKHLVHLFIFLFLTIFL